MTSSYCRYAKQGIDLAVMKQEIIHDSLQFLRNSSMYEPQFDPRTLIVHPNLAVFTMEYYSTLVGMIDLNGSNVAALPSLRNELCTVLKCSEDEVPHAVGTGLFMLQSCLNHSCRPNCEVVGALTNAVDARIKVMNKEYYSCDSFEFACKLKGNATVIFLFIFV